MKYRICEDGVRPRLLWLLGLGGQRTEDRGRRTESSRQVGNGGELGAQGMAHGGDGYRKELTLKVLRKHIKRLVNCAEAGDGVKIREELRRIVPEYDPKG